MELSEPDHALIPLHIENGRVRKNLGIIKNFMTENLQILPENLPSDSGVYFMKDQEGNILYIGKAKNLKKELNLILYLPRNTPLVSP